MLELSGAAKGLAEKLTGRIVLPAHPEYDRLRRVWNHDIDERPALIVLCAAEDDIRRTLDFARSRALPIAIRGGGHSFAGHGVCEGGVVINLSLMKTTQIDPQRRRVSAGPGVVGGELDRVTQAFGLALPLGSCPSVGVVGYATGGGEGSLTPRFGFGCDNMSAARLITADSRVLDAENTSNEDVFWALRGGGGNFGIVTNLEFDLHPITTVLSGHLIYPLKRTSEVLNFVNTFVQDIPPELYLIVTVLPKPGERMLDIGVVWSGEIREGERVLRPLREFIEASQDSIKANRYLDEQQSGSDSPSDGDWCSFRRAGHMELLNPRAIEAIAQHCGIGPSEYCGISMIYWHGPWVERPHDNAFGFRRVGFEYWIHAYWQDPSERERSHRWVGDFHEALRPFSTKGVYVNNLGEEGEERVRTAYGDNYARLSAIKRKYDPHNIFRINQNIRP
jgi:hypothetical protein